jgi:hypothetical protein
MYSRKFGAHGMISAIVAISLLAIGAFVLDRGYLLAAPGGVVQVDRLTPVQSLDEIVVVSKR